MKLSLTDLADVFDKLAEEEDNFLKRKHETTTRETKDAKAEAATKKDPEPPAEKDNSKEAADAFQELTGVALDPKIASSMDKTAVERLRKLAADQRSPERLGGPSDRPGARPAPRSREEAKQAAYDRFGDFLMSEPNA